jgi:CRISPR-associated protein Csd1
MLAQLKEYYERQGDRTPPLHLRMPVRYVVELDQAGALSNPVPIDRATGNAKGTSRGTPLVVPNIVRSSGDAPMLLADGSDYTFGVDPDARPERRSERHRLYSDLVADCAAVTGESSVEAVRLFLESGEHPQFPIDFDYGATVTFSVDGQLPVQLPSVQRYWRDRFEREELAKLEAVECVVCGRQEPALITYPIKIKGIRGGQTSGTTVVSANSTAFESYGLQGSQTSPTCLDCADSTTKGLNELIAGERTHLYLGGVTFVFWTRSSAQPFDFYTLVAEPTPESVQDVLQSARTGRPVAGVEADRFYAAALTGSGGRAVVRDWIDTSLPEAQQHLAQWFERQRVADWDGSEGGPLSLYALAGATLPVRRGQPRWDDLAPTVPRALLRAALTGSPVPWDVLFRVIHRARAERGVRRAHAAVIKLVLLSQDAKEEEAPMSLNPDHPDVAYQCGRLLAVLEEAQRAAMPRVTNTIVDRFYGTASSAPATVFGRLLRGVQPHLSTLESVRPPAYFAIQGKLEEVSRHIPAFPLSLTLREQGLFALGYYHQRAQRPARAAEPNATPATS